MKKTLEWNYRVFFLNQGNSAAKKGEGSAGQRGNVVAGMHRGLDQDSGRVQHYGGLLERKRKADPWKRDDGSWSPDGEHERFEDYAAQSEGDSHGAGSVCD